MSGAREELAAIHTFPQLVRYLRDELDWPISTDDFESSVFDYSAEDLGIDAHNAAKIEEIKRLRPLSVDQPWGIFFVKFEPKRLPVVALRRILSGVALRKRASANSPDHAAWAVSDLLFISNYGEGETRQIAFAHFAEGPDRQSLPTLKVLGWDNLDTALHLDDVAESLAHNLVWPDDEADATAWRTRWESAFTIGHREVINTSREMAIRLAELARAIRDRITGALAIETDRGPLTQLMKAVQVSLVHDLDARGFADMYAQTIAYGLLSARISDPESETAGDLVGHMRTNPLLRDLLETFLQVGGRRAKAGGPGIDFDELGVSEVVEVLSHRNIEAVIRDFGDRNPEDDPVIHFYELFLKEYDERQRMQRGVFYTPRPVVSYIVRSVDGLLRSGFGLADGLADTTTWAEMVARDRHLSIPQGVPPSQAFVQILDPATGTGTFLVEIIDIVHKTMTAKWRAEGATDQSLEARWNEYVPKDLLPRLHGFELLMAPYAIAHLKVGLKLYETGYRFGSDERAGVYLTNSLEPPQDYSGRLEFAIPALAHEAEAVDRVKTLQRFTVVVGNPPYSNRGQLNRVPFILALLDEYKRGLDEKKLNLDDDYLKFIRLAQHLIDTSGLGVVGMITNSSYIDGLVHRRMRESLVSSFPRSMVFDLHGNSRRKERAPDGGSDENVFDIQQGVAISIWVKDGQLRVPRMSHQDIWGLRNYKYRQLGATTVALGPWTEFAPAPPSFFFRPTTSDAKGLAEFASFWPLTDIFGVFGSGMTAERDRVAIHFTLEELKETLRDFRAGDIAYLRAKYELGEDSRDWTVAGAIEDVRTHLDDVSLITRILYRPFDYRYTWYSAKSRGFVGTPVPSTGVHLARGGNVALLAPRQTKERVGAFVSASLAGHKSFSAYDRTSVFPLRLVHGDESRSSGLFPDPPERTNLKPGFVRAIDVVMEAESRRAQEPLDDETSVGIFSYIYAILNSPAYRSRYRTSLQSEFPRIPIPLSSKLFRALRSCDRIT